VRRTRKGRGYAFSGLILIGFMFWLSGAIDLFPQMPLLSLAALLCGSLQAVAAAYLLLTTRPSGQRDHRVAEGVAFCMSFAFGVAAIGFAISPLTTWLSPAIDFVVGGLTLIAWSPQAFVRRRV
jgi:hypothetical protein